MEIKEHQLEPSPRPVSGFGNQDEIYLSIEIGNGQIGGSKVSLSETLLAKGRLTQPTLIGTVSELRNKTIDIETNILDVNAFTNMCVLTTTWYNQNNKVLFTKIDKGEAPENGIASFKGKYLFSFVFFILFMAGAAQAQHVNETTFQDLQTPSSPGFILLDNAPASIERPTTPQGVGVGILGFLKGSGGALEFAPFWLTTHAKLTAEKMYTNKFPVLYNLAVSVATIKTDTTNYLTGGFRTRLFQLHQKDRKNKLDSIRALLEELLPDPIANMATIETLRIAYVKIISEEVEKPIFTIDAAAAIGAGSETNSFNDLARNRWAAWLAFNYRPKGDDFYFTVLTRYLYNEKFEEYTVKSDLMDVGTRLNYDISKFCLSLEYLQRMNFTEQVYNDYRIAVIGSYALSENLFITSTFGKNFTEVNNIVAMAGINFGFSRNKVKAY